MQYAGYALLFIIYPSCTLKFVFKNVIFLLKFCRTTKVIKKGKCK